MSDDEKTSVASEIDRAPYEYYAKPSGKDALSYFLKRIWAFGIDLVILSPLYFGTLFLYINIQFESIREMALNLNSYVILIIYAITFLIYASVTEYYLEGSPGKKMVNLLSNTPPLVGSLWAFSPIITLLLPWLFLLKGVIFIIIYFVLLIIVSYFSYNSEATPKELVVVSVDKKRISFHQAFFRNIGKIVPFLAIADGVTMFFTGRKQRIFDKIAGTVVLPGEVLQWASKRDEE